MSLQHREIAFRVFLWRTKTLENDLMLIGGICDNQIWPEIMERLHQLPKASFANLRDAYALDWKLSQITTSFGEDIAIIGASVAIPNLAERGGGILGSPLRDSASAAHELDELENSLFLWTSPGGPGVAFRADKSMALEMKRCMEACQDSDIKQQTERISGLLHAHGIDLFLLVCDGSGPQGNCYMAAADDTGFYEIG